MVTRLIREERCEFLHNRAVEARPYVERVTLLFELILTGYIFWRFVFVFNSK